MNFEDVGITLKSISFFALKVLAIVFSTFQEVLYLDVDQVVLRDPGFLFDDKTYTALGLLMWKDFWKPSYATDVYKIIRGDLSDWTHESGQIVVNKALVWHPLLLACHFNMHYKVFYPLSNGYLGWGDKETIPFAFYYMKIKYDVVDYFPDHVGIETMEGLLGNSMVHFWKDKKPLFLHANLGKYNGVLTKHPLRRWRSSLMYGEDIVPILERTFGVDLESWVHNVTIQIQCEPWYQRLGQLKWYEKLDIGPLLEGMYIFNKGDRLHPALLKFNHSVRLRYT